MSLTRTPQPGGEIVLVCRKHPSTNQKEYWTVVLGKEVDAAPDSHWSRATDALDSTKLVLPGIRAERKAAKAKETDATAAVMAEIQAKYNDPGKPAEEQLEYDDLGNPFVVNMGDDEPADIEPVIDEFPQETVSQEVYDLPESI